MYKGEKCLKSSKNEINMQIQSSPAPGEPTKMSICGADVLHIIHTTKVMRAGGWVSANKSDMTADISSGEKG